MKPVSVQAALASSSQALQAAGLEDALADARFLLAAVLEKEPKYLFSCMDMCLSGTQQQRLHHLVKRRLAHEPVSRIIGQRGFWTLDLCLSPATLDPRPDSETLIELALEHMAQRQNKDQPLYIADLGTGTGALLLALLSEWPNAYGLGLDISLQALEIARCNAQRHALQERCAFVQGDWGACLTPVFDLVISNPPYIPSDDIAALKPDVRCYDPLLALDGGGDGLRAYERLLAATPQMLRSGGILILEAGWDQAADIIKLMQQAGFAHCTTRKDLGGHERAVCGVYKPKHD